MSISVTGGANAAISHSGKSVGTGGIGQFADKMFQMRFMLFLLHISQFFAPLRLTNGFDGYIIYVGV